MNIDRLRKNRGDSISLDDWNALIGKLAEFERSLGVTAGQIGVDIPGVGKFRAPRVQVQAVGTELPTLFGTNTTAHELIDGEVVKFLSPELDGDSAPIPAVFNTNRIFRAQESAGPGQFLVAVGTIAAGAIGQFRAASLRAVLVNVSSEANSGDWQYVTAPDSGYKAVLAEEEGYRIKWRVGSTGEQWAIVGAWESAGGDNVFSCADMALCCWEKFVLLPGDEEIEERFMLIPKPCCVGESQAPVWACDDSFSTVQLHVPDDISGIACGNFSDTLPFAAGVYFLEKNEECEFAPSSFMYRYEASFPDPVVDISIGITAAGRYSLKLENHNESTNWRMMWSGWKISGDEDGPRGIYAKSCSCDPETGPSFLEVS